MDDIKSRLKLQLQNTCISYGIFTLSSGKESTYYIDCRKGFGDPITYRLIKILMMEEVVKCEPIHQVGGPAVGAVTLVGMAVQDGYNGFYVRREPKTHGTGNQIEGIFDREAPTVLVDEIITTGGSIRFVMDLINKENVKALVCIVNRSGLDNIDGIPIRAIFQDEELYDPSKE